MQQSSEFQFPTLATKMGYAELVVQWSGVFVAIFCGPSVAHSWPASNLPTFDRGRF